MAPQTPILQELESWLTLERFDYARVGERWAVLRLLAAIGQDLGAPVEAKLVIERELGTDAYPARACALERRILPGGRHGPSSGLLWRATFALPLEIMDHRETTFELAAHGLAAITLPQPVPRVLDRQTLILGQSPYRAASHRKLQLGHVKLRVAAFATAVAVTTASTPAIGLAATGTPHNAIASRSNGSGAQGRLSGHALAMELLAKAAVNAHLSAASSLAAGAPASSAPRALGSSRAVGPDGRPCLPREKQPTLADPRPAAKALPNCPPAAKSHRKARSKKRDRKKPRRETLSLPANLTSHHASKPGKSAPSSAPSSGANGGTGLTSPPSSGAPTTPPPAATPPATTPPATTLPSTLARAAAPKVRTEPRSAAEVKPAKRHVTSAKRPTGGAALSQTPVTLPAAPTSAGFLAPGFTGPQSWAGTVNTNPELSGALSNLSDLLANGNRPPAFLIPLYMEAGKRYHVPWTVLAAINSIETNYGRNLNTSSAGAIGWMQFMPATWHQYGTAVDGHSMPNPYDARDAIFSAARYLAAAGAATNVPRAVLAYNHAGWYVDEVLTRARAIAAGVHYTGAHVRHDVLSIKVESSLFKHGAARFNGGYMTHFDRLVAAANMVSAANFPYLYGGGHEQPARFAAFDCSGAVSYVLQQAGYTVPTTVSGNVPSWHFPAGPGAVTIFYNPGHTFMRIGNRYFGTSGFARPGGGAGWFDTNKLPASYLATFSVVHLPHLHANSFTRHLLRTRAHSHSH
jgi:membrane-bound lytic murein transglycosylase B